MRHERLIEVVRVRIRNARFALRSKANLNKITEGAIAGLAADQRIHTAAMNEVLARLERGSEGGASGVTIQGLHHPQTPVAARAARIRAGGRMSRLPRRSVPRDIDAAIIACDCPYHDVGDDGRVDIAWNGTPGDRKSTRLNSSH